MKNRRLISFLAALVLVVCSCATAAALSASTLSVGSRGDSVKKLQQALIDLGYLKGKADGIFGQQTYKAVCSFQTAKKLTVDGLAGKKTQSVLFAASAAAPAAASDAAPAASSASSSSASSSSASSSSATASGGDLFKGNYATLRIKDRNDRVKIMQQALIRLNYLSGKADGIFGNKTEQASKDFKRDNGLKYETGTIGKKTAEKLGFIWEG